MKNKINRMYVLSFFFTLHIALSAYINSTFLTKIISEKYVGLLFAGASLMTLFLLSRSVNLLKHFGNRKFIIWALIVNMLSLVGMISSTNPYVIGVSFIALMATNTLVLLSMDIFIEHFCNPKTIGKTRGLYLTVINLAWITTPLISAYLITKENGFISIYILSFVAALIMAIGLLFSISNFKDSKYKKTPFLETYRYLKTNHHMLAITILNFILQFFYAWMVVYMPIYLYQHIGFGWDQIGIIFTIMLTPFIIFGLPVGILIDKFHVKKRTLLYIGILIMSISTFAISFLTTKTVAIWAIMLFITRMGASITETTSEIYFFTHTGEKDAYLLSIYRDMVPVAYIVGPLVSTLIFIFLPLKFLFAILGVILLTGFYYIPHLKHNHDYVPNTN